MFNLIIHSIFVIILVYSAWVNIRLGYLTRRIFILTTKAMVQMDLKFSLYQDLPTINDNLTRINKLSKLHSYRHFVKAALQVWRPIDKLYPENLFDEEWPTLVGENQK